VALACPSRCKLRDGATALDTLVYPCLDVSLKPADGVLSENDSGRESSTRHG
jgi:hypothetical protein